MLGDNNISQLRHRCLFVFFLLESFLKNPTIELFLSLKAPNKSRVKTVQGQVRSLQSLHKRHQPLHDGEFMKTELKCYF